MRAVLILLAGMLLAVLAVAQPVAGRAFTETVYAGGDYPEDRVAQGSVFRVDGLNLAAGDQSAGFPLPTSLGGTSIRVSAGGRSVDALILSTPVFLFQGGPRPSVRAVLPSNAPLGEAELVLTFNGQESQPLKIRVVKREFGLYDLVHNVDGPGLIQQNTLEHPTRPGQLVGIWGTGLGPVDGDEAAGPLPAALSIPGLEMLVGGTPAKVVYAGRSGCCAGIDQIFFEVPAGVDGCSVAVKVRYPDGGAEDAPKTNFGEVSLVVAGPSVDCTSLARPRKYGRINPSSIAGNLDYSHASFYTGGPDVLPPLGTCGAGRFLGRLPYLDAGAAIRLAAPGFTVIFTHPPSPPSAPPSNDYSSPSPFSNGSPLPPGPYVIDNGDGGADLAPFRTSLSLPEIAFTWTNRDSVSVRPDEGLRITWNGGVAGDGYVVITGVFSIAPGAGETPPLMYADYQGWFFCIERAGKEAFVVPPADAWTSLTRHADHLELSVYHVYTQKLDVPGLDLAEFVYDLGAYRIVKLP